MTQNVVTDPIEDQLRLVEDLQRRGWAVFPVKHGDKLPAGHWPTMAAAHPTPDMLRSPEWFGELRNIGLACGPSKLVVLDGDVVDAVETLCREHGREVPDTYVVETSGGRKHWYFRAPTHVILGNSPGRLKQRGIDVRGEGGYVVAEGSLHPSGDVYRCLYPWAAPAELPTWIIDLILEKDVARDTRALGNGHNEVADPQHATPFTREDAQKYCDSSLARLRMAQPGDRNNSLNSYALALGHFVRDDGTGFYDPFEAREMCRAIARDIGYMEEEPEACERTISSGLRAGMAQPYNITFEERPARVEVHEDEPLPIMEAPNLPDTFWNMRKTLQHIRQAAWASYASPDAVLAACLARQSAFMFHGDKLNIGFRSDSALNIFSVLYATSGGGKGIAVRTAKDLLPIPEWLGFKDFAELVPGSGEGLTESYFGKMPDPLGSSKLVRAQVRHNILFEQSEGEAFIKVSERNGSTLATTMRKAWMGESLGEANANDDRNRFLGEGQYVMGMVLGFQPAQIQPLLTANEGFGGTVQRFVYLRAEDPSFPDVLPEWPGPLTLPRRQSIGGHGTLSGPAPLRFVLTDPEGLAEVDGARKVGVRGQEDSGLDSHLYLLQGRIAAIFAYWEGRTEISKVDWHLARHVMAISGDVRDAAINWGERKRAGELRVQEDRSVRRDARSAVAATEAVDTAREKRIEKAVANLVRKVRREGPRVKHRVLKSYVSLNGEELREALKRCTESDLLVAEPDGRGTVYSVGHEAPNVPD